MNLQDLSITLRLATVTTAILLALALPLARWIALSPRGAKSLVEALVALPLVLPPTVLGFYLLVLMGPRTAPGRWITAMLGHPLAFSFSGLVLGSVIYSLPFAVQPLVSGFSAVDPALLDAARLLGAGPAAVFFRVLLPLSTRSILTAAVLAFTHTVGEFGVVLMIGGDLPGSTRTLSISIYDQVQNFAYADANRTALLLLGFSFAALLLVYTRWQRPGHASGTVSA
ncbi:MAG TPA: molybdate ABC transporter permease subunit [Acidisarcina sp.]